MPTIYSKNSFERFGDDLCEEILSYLPIEDRIKYECLSKQWKRSVYQRVNQLVINPINDLTKKLFSDKQMKDNMCGLESLLKKLPNMTHLSIKGYTSGVGWHEFSAFKPENRFFELIAKYCHKLKSIETNFCTFGIDLSQTWNEWIPSILLAIVSYDCDLRAIDDLQIERLTQLSIPSYIDPLFKQIDESFVIRGLTHLKIDCYSGDEQFCRTMIGSNKQLMSLDIIFFSQYINTTEGLFSDVSDLTQLKCLRLSLKIESDRDFERIRMIGQKCQRLEKLVIIEYSNYSPIGHRSLTIIEDFPNLVSLDLQEYTFEKFSQSLSCSSLANCPNLRQLKLSFKGLTDSFFKDIHTFVPKLSHLSINRCKISEHIIDYIERLTELQTVVIRNMRNIYCYDIESIDFMSFKYLFDNCLRLKSVLLSIDGESQRFDKSYHDGIISYQHNYSSIYSLITKT